MEVNGPFEIGRFSLGGRIVRVFQDKTTGRVILALPESLRNSPAIFWIDDSFSTEQAAELTKQFVERNQ
jgi:hypothetical protein